MSETSLVYTNWEHSDAEDAVLAETLSYGITRNFSMNATIADLRMFDYPKYAGYHGHDRYDNPAWSAGLKYNLVDCCKTNWKVQLGADYTQGTLSLNNYLLALAGFDHHAKAISAYGKAGYQMGRFLPYLAATVIKPIGRDYEGQPVISTRAALNTVLGKKTNLDLGVTYDWDNDTNAGKHMSAWSVDGALNYVFSDCMSAGLTGAYLMRTKIPDWDGTFDVDSFKVGVNFKVAF
ncbi:MAG: hypothetical protein IKS41_02325 [Alphaproteobacteria bacterium]|nr:hypothetical protein [Alphaproteobacteria bacterium]